MDTRKIEKAPYRFHPLPLKNKPSGLPILMALQKLGRSMYEGTVPREVIMRRRMRNKMARMSRRANRAKKL